jgi:hypothetical protein
VTVVVGIGIVVLAGTGLGIGVRHLYLRLDRPHGINCSLRVTRGTVPGLTHRFRAGYAGPELTDLLWRRVAWPDPPVRIPIPAVRFDTERRPARRERLSLPASFSVFAVEWAEDVTLELGLARRHRGRLLALLDPRGPGPRRR